MKTETKIFIVLGVGVAAITTLIVLKKNRSHNTPGSDWIKPVEGRLSSPFGTRTDPVTHKQDSGHNGQDIAVPVGTKVKAPRAGKIYSTTPSEGGGNQVVMIHNEPGKFQNWFSGFAHLSKVLVVPGQRVKQGEVIALSGATGEHITGPHLHYTMTDDKGVKLDPRIYIYK